MSQQALADSAGITRSQLARLESGGTPNPGVRSLVPLARALTVSLDELVGTIGSASGPQLTDAYRELLRRTDALGKEPYDWLTDDEFARWAEGTSLSMVECRNAIIALNENAILPPPGSPVSASAAHFVVGAAAGALLERWRGFGVKR